VPSGASSCAQLGALRSAAGAGSVAAAKYRHRQACRQWRTLSDVSLLVNTVKGACKSSGDHRQRVHALACGVGVKHQVHAEPPTTSTCRYFKAAADVVTLRLAEPLALCVSYFTT